MKKTKILLVGALLLGVPSVALSLSTQQENPTVVRADTQTMTATVSTKSSVTLRNSLTGLNVSYSQTYNTAKQLTKGNSATLTIKNGGDYNLSALKLQMKSNSKSGSGSLTYTTENATNTLISNSTYDTGWSTKFTSSYEWITIQLNSSIELTNTFQLKISATDNSLYIQSYEMTFEKASTKHNVYYVTNCDTQLDSKQFAEESEITLPTEELTKEDYIFDGWFIDADFKNKFVVGTKMGKNDITLYAHWVPDTSIKYIVTFMLNDGTDTIYTSTKVKENDKVTIPEIPTRDGYKFVNWYTTDNLIEEFDFNTNITTDLTLYAGWETAPKYTKVTSKLEDWSGKYLIVYENDKVCFNGSLEELDNASNTKSVLIKDNQIIGDYENYQFTFEKKDTGYSIKSYSNIYIGKTASSNGLDESLENKYYNYISINTSGIVSIKGSGGALLKYNTTDGQDRFRFYKNGQQDIALYKLEEKQEEQPTVDEATLTSYTSTLSIDNSKAIRFIGSVKETEFDKISKIGFNFTLTLDNDKGNPISKEYSSDVTKLYKTINDSNTGTFDKTDAVYEKDGFLNFSLILKNMPKDLLASIYYYSYAVIDGKTYNSPTTEVVIAGDLIEFR